MTGMGLPNNPYNVMNYGDLCNMTEGDKYYKLCTDIDFSQIERSPGAGSIKASFKSFDGNGHTISNFFSRVDSSTQYNSLFKINTTSESTRYIKNLNLKGIYLAGGITRFLDINTGNFEISNCRISTKINDTQNSAKSSFFDKTLLTDCEVLIEGTADYTKQITSTDTSGCLMKLNLTFFNNNYTTEAEIFNGTLSCCGIIGKIICKSSQGGYYKLTNSEIINSYFALNFENITSLAADSFSGVNFYDKEVMANVVEFMPSVSNLYALTTEQCKSAEYLQSIGFPCVSGDVL